MKALISISIALLMCSVLSAKVIKAESLADAIHISNTTTGKDSLYLSDFTDFTITEDTKQFDITDQLVLINDLGSDAELLKGDVLFKVAITGALDLVGFDFRDFDARFINLGKITIEHGTFQEGKDLTQKIKNRGLFEIKNGNFLGSPSGLIIKHASFKVGAPIIL